MMRILLILLSALSWSCSVDATPDRCEEMPDSLRIVLDGYDEEQCLAERECWDEDECFTEKCNTSCAIPEIDRIDCFETTASACRAKGCCWDDAHAMPCYTCRVHNQCHSNDRVPCSVPATTVEDCNSFLCCFDPDDTISPCYQPADCFSQANYYGACSKTCGLGQRALYNGCGWFLEYNTCCVGPCPPTYSDVTDGVTCSASGETPGFECQNAFNGILDPSIPNAEWATPEPNEGSVIELEFASGICIKAVELTFRCAYQDQAQTYMLTFFDPFGNKIEEMEHKRSCNGGTTISDCDSQNSETVVIKPVNIVPGSYMRIENYDLCNPSAQDINQGFREIVLLGDASPCGGGGNSGPSDPSNPPQLCRNFAPYGPR